MRGGESSLECWGQSYASEQVAAFDMLDRLWFIDVGAHEVCGGTTGHGGVPQVLSGEARTSALPGGYSDCSGCKWWHGMVHGMSFCSAWWSWCYGKVETVRDAWLGAGILCNGGGINWDDEEVIWGVVMSHDVAWLYWHRLLCGSVKSWEEIQRIHRSIVDDLTVADKRYIRRGCCCWRISFSFRFTCSLVYQQNRRPWNSFDLCLILTSQSDLWTLCPC